MLDFGFVVSESHFDLLKTELEVLDFVKTLRRKLVEIGQLLRQFRNIGLLLCDPPLPELILRLLLLEVNFFLDVFEGLSDHGLGVVPQTQSFISEIRGDFVLLRKLKHFVLFGCYDLDTVALRALQIRAQFRTQKLHCREGLRLRLA